MGITDNERDITLWNQFKNGDEEAFVVLFRNYYSGLFNYGCKITADSELVEDCIQELFMEIWRSAGKADIISFKAYIFKAFKFKMVRLITKNNKARSISDTTTENAFELSHDNFIIDKELNAAKREKVLQALQELSPRQKEIIYLKFYQSLSYEEVSEIMQINYQAARNLIYQAIKVMKNAITYQLIFGLLLNK